MSADFTVLCLSVSPFDWGIVMMKKYIVCYAD